MESYIITPFKDCNLEIIGEFIKEEPNINIPNMFEIDSIIPLEKDIYDLLEWISTTKDYLTVFENLCLKQILENE